MHPRSCTYEYSIMTKEKEAINLRMKGLMEVVGGRVFGRG